MRSDWPVVKLGDYCSKIGSGATPKGGNSVYIDSGEISLIRSQNIYNDGFKSDGLVYITTEAAQKLKNVIIEPNDVLINITGDSVARVCLAPNEFLPARVNQHVAILRVDLEKFDHRYLRYFLTSTKMQNYLLTIASTGGTRNALTKSMLESLEVSKPPLEIQKQIGDVLENVESKIELNTQTNQTLEQMAQAIFKSWFVDFDPVKAKMKGEQPEGMDAATAALFPDKLVESELGLIPEGWEAKSLGDYLTIKRGGSPRPIKDFIVPDGYSWTKIADATANDNPYIFKTKEFIKEEGLKKTVYLKKGTLILSNSATPGLPRFLELDACIHDGWLHFPEKNHFTDSYLYQLFLHIRKHLVSQGNGSVFTNLKTDILRNQIVLVPPKELVDIYEKHAGKFLEAVKAKSIENNQLAHLRDTLLPKLLSGEIKLDTVENKLATSEEMEIA